MDPATAALIAAGAQQLWNVGSSLVNRRRRRKAKNKRRAFFDENIQPLLDDMDTTDDDVDYGALREREMQLPIAQFQNQLNDITRGRDASVSGSGFAGSGFIDSDFDRSKDLASTTFQDQSFSVDRGIVEMQSQLEQMINENKLRARELEFSYRHG